MATTRRVFVKQSLAACATAAVALPVRAATPAPAKEAPGAASKAPVTPHPLVPYGSGTPIYHADLDRCQPASALAPRWKKKHWKTTTFETPHLKGVMVAAGQNTGVPDIEYALPHEGWFAISLGLLSKYWESRIQVRLKRDKVFTLLTQNEMAELGLNRRELEHSGHWYYTRHFDELFWRYVKLQPGDALVFRQLRVQVTENNPEEIGNTFAPCWLGYIKLVPLSADEARRHEADLAGGKNRRLIATCDAFGSLSWLHPQTEDDIRREIEPYRNSDFGRMDWEAGMGDLTYYPSKVGKLITFEWMDDHYRRMDRLVGRTYTKFRERGIDPFRIALEHCRELGMEFHAGYRVAGFYFPTPEDEWNHGGLYHQHKEWRAIDREGREVPRLSYVFPGVREFVLKLLREVVTKYPVDGISLLYNRRLPLLDFEAPLVDSFRQQHGVDPHTLPDSDPRWLAHRAQVITGFMRDVRAMLAEEQRRQGRAKPFAVTAVVVSSEKENYENALDLATWIKEGLIDTLIPYSSVAGINSSMVSWENPRDADDFIRLTRGTPCKLALNLMPRQIKAEDYKRRAHALYEAGIDYLYFWDCYQRTNFDRTWTTLSRLGHREELAEWARKGKPPLERPRQELTKIADWDLSYGTPG